MIREYLINLRSGQIERKHVFFKFFQDVDIPKLRNGKGNETFLNYL